MNLPREMQAMRRIDVRSVAALPVKMGIIGVERFHAEGDFRHLRTTSVFDLPPARFMDRGRSIPCMREQCKQLLACQ